jgi:hypothetical protein
VAGGTLIGEDRLIVMDGTNVFIKPFLHQQMSQSAYTEIQPKTPNSKQYRRRSIVARKNSLERQEPRIKP